MVPATAEDPPADVLRWGNAEYVNLSIGDSHTYQGHTISLTAVNCDRCRVDVDGVAIELTVARRLRPTHVGSIRLFAADNRPVAELTSDDSFPLIHAALTKDAIICISDASRPLLDRERFVFPISRQDGFVWRMTENSHMFAYLRPPRAHEGIDINMHEARGRNIHRLVAIENCRVAVVAGGKPNEACVILQSTTKPDIFYIYQHLYRPRVAVREGEQVKRGDPIGTIWGDGRWGHLHFAALISDTVPTFDERYQSLLNCFPQLYELWHGDLASRPFERTSGDFRFAPQYYRGGNVQCLNAYSDVLGYGWLLGDWCTASKVESSRTDEGLKADQSAILRRVMHRRTVHPALNPSPDFDFEVDVLPGRYRVRARIGDQFEATWQRVQFEDTVVGEYDQPAGQVRWTPETQVQVDDGRLTIRLSLRGDEQPAGIRELYFVKDR